MEKRDLFVCLMSLILYSHQGSIEHEKNQFNKLLMKYHQENHIKYKKLKQNKNLLQFLLNKILGFRLSWQNVIVSKAKDMYLPLMRVLP